MEWSPIPPNVGDGQPVQLYADGRFSLAGFPVVFDRTSALQSMIIRGVRVDKAFGEGQQLIIHSSPPIVYRYEGGQWFQKSTSAERPSITPIHASPKRGRGTLSHRNVMIGFGMFASVVVGFFALSLFISSRRNESDEDSLSSVQRGENTNTSTQPMLLNSNYSGNSNYSSTNARSSLNANVSIERLSNSSVSSNVARPSPTQPDGSARLMGTITLDIDPTTNLVAAPTCPVIRSKSFRIGQQPTQRCGPEQHQSTPDDKTIRDNVEELIINDEWLGNHILFASIEVRNGEVTIHGKLPTEDLTKEAHRKISTIRGVRKVEFVR